MSDRDHYSSPLADRYASREMLALWSAQTRHATWRRIWLALAEAEHELGAEVPAAALVDMRAHLDDIDFTRAAEYERQFRHDVMAHVHTFGDAAPAGLEYRVFASLTISNLYRRPGKLYAIVRPLRPFTSIM